MSNSKDKSPRRRAEGYTLVELMVAMTLALILLGMAFTFFNDMNNTSDLAGSIADVNENLRAAVNMISSDLMTAGTEIPTGGIPIPGGGTATQINLPAPGGSWAFPPCSPAPCTPPTGSTLPVIVPGPGLGPATGSGTTQIPTDLITMISVNQLSQLDQYPLTAFTTSVSAVTITVDPRTLITAGNPSYVVPGQLIMLSNVNASCLLTVTAVNYTTNVLTFTHNDSKDVLGLNQFSGPASGTIAQLLMVGTPPTPLTTAYHVNMVTYYLDLTMNTLNPSVPNHKLLKQVLTNPFGGASNPPQPVALGINVLQFAYSLQGGCTTPSDPCRMPGTLENAIRKVNVWAIGQADHPSRRTGRYFSNSIAISVTVQNLSYSNKYGTSF